MDAQHKVGAVQLSGRLGGVSPPVIRRLRVAEQTSLAELHAARDPINRERRRVWRVCRPRPRATGRSVASGPDRYDKCVF
jgi:hypothetical protein